MMFLEDPVWHLQGSQSDYLDGRACVSSSAQIQITPAVGS